MQIHEVCLVMKLNALGPPIRTSMEWRRVWSVFKYNRKRKRSQAGDVQSNVCERSSLRGGSIALGSSTQGNSDISFSRALVV